MALASRPLSAKVYLLRNANRSIPLTAVIVLAVMLVAGIVAMMDSIPYSIRTIYNYSRYSLGITPRGDAAMTPELRKRLISGSPVPIERIILCRASGSQVRSIVGKWPFVVLAMKQDDLRYYLDKLGATDIVGRLPNPGAAEALISEPVARNLNLKLGDVLIGPDLPDSYSINPVHIVGIARSPQWVMLAPIEYHQTHHFPPVDNLLAFARNLTDQEKLDRWAEREFKGERAQIFAYHDLEKSTNEMFDILYKILNVVIGTLVLVITLMMVMLINIYQVQRMQEFGLLQALGYTKRQLLQRVWRENLVVVIIGWIIGVATAILLLLVVRSQLMDPQAFALDVLNPRSYLYTLPIPMTILVAANAVVANRFRRFDPVGVVERRLA
ncbi:MAG: hypothetical protein HONBIEJF_01354 [Fimbriimonadaceae bacterium]|nr:hypothetical protein [Fimbriimonadaceae bacterium]